jgi:hypothetical protein
VPDGYTAATLFVDATAKNPLTWEEEYKAAEELVKNGIRVCFELGLDLFTTRFEILTFAIDEFRKRLLEPFQEHTDAVILFRGPLEVERMPLLDALRQELPPDLCVLLLFDATNTSMIIPDRYSLFTLALKNSPHLVSCCCWQEGKALLGYIGRDIAHYTPTTCTKGVVISRECQSLPAITGDFKIISQETVGAEWEGIDELYVQSDTLQPTTLRLLEGFQAAGGIVIDQKGAFTL